MSNNEQKSGGWRTNKWIRAAIPACLIISLSILLKSRISLSITLRTTSALILSNNGYDLPYLIVPNKFAKNPPVNSSKLKPL